MIIWNTLIIGKQFQFF